MLRTPEGSLDLYILSFEAGISWEMGQDCQLISWRKDKKILIAGLFWLDWAIIPRWGRRFPQTRWTGAGVHDRMSHPVTFLLCYNSFIIWNSYACYSWSVQEGNREPWPWNGAGRHPVASHYQNGRRIWALTFWPTWWDQPRWLPPVMLPSNIIGAV